MFIKYIFISILVIIILINLLTVQEDPPLLIQCPRFIPTTKEEKIVTPGFVLVNNSQ